MSRRRPDRKPSENQQAVMRDHLLEIVGFVMDNYPDLEHQADMRGGLRSSSLGVMGSGGVSDPTGDAAVEERADVADWARDCLTMVDEFYAVAKSLENRVRRLLPPEATEEGDDGCRSCRRLAKNFSPVYRSERCRACYNFWLVEKVDPPLDLLIARKEGRRWTTRLVNEALGRKSA